MKKTKETIIEHSHHENLYRLRNGKIAKLTDIRAGTLYPLMLKIINTTPQEHIALTETGKYSTNAEKDGFDIVDFICCTDIKQPNEYPCGVNLSECVEDGTYLRTRGGAKVLLLEEDNRLAYPFSGVVLNTDSAVTERWCEDGSYTASGVQEGLDIVGLWKEGE